MADPSRLARALDEVRDELTDWRAAATAVAAGDRSASNVAASLAAAASSLAAAVEVSERQASSVAAARDQAGQAFRDAAQGGVAVAFRAASVQRSATYAHETLRWWNQGGAALTEAVELAGRACRVADQAAEAAASAEAHRLRSLGAADGALAAAGDAANGRSRQARALRQAERHAAAASAHGDEVCSASALVGGAGAHVATLAGLGIRALADKAAALRRYDRPADLGLAR